MHDEVMISELTKCIILGCTAEPHVLDKCGAAAAAGWSTSWTQGRELVRVVKG